MRTQSCEECKKEKIEKWKEKSETTWKQNNKFRQLKGHEKWNTQVTEMQDCQQIEWIQPLKYMLCGHSLLEHRHPGRKWQIDADGVGPGMSTNTVMPGCSIHLTTCFPDNQEKHPVTCTLS